MSGNHNGKRAVLYARTSYDDRDTDGRNLAGQLEMAREYALGKGYRIVAELASKPYFWRVVLDPAGCPVSTYSETMAASTRSWTAP